MQELDLEVGKHYRDNTGDKILLVHKLKNGHFVGVVVQSARGNVDFVCEYTTNGTTNVGQIATLVAEWRDEIEVHGWINVYNRRSRIEGLYHPTKEEADLNAVSDRIACVEVHGQGYKL